MRIPAIAERFITSRSPFPPQPRAVKNIGNTFDRKGVPSFFQVNEKNIEDGIPALILQCLRINQILTAHAHELRDA